MTIERQKFSTQADPGLLATIKAIAKKEGRQFQSILEDAMKLYVEYKTSDKPRDSVMAHLQASIEKNRMLGKLLAK